MGERYLVYEMAKKSSMGQGDIWVTVEENDVKHILSVIDIKKMIPIVDGVYSRVNINSDDTDIDDVKKYKDLLNKEYSFCLKIINEVIRKANKLYDKQMALNYTTQEISPLTNNLKYDTLILILADA